MDLTEKEISRQSSQPFKIKISDLNEIIDTYRSRTFTQDIDRIEKMGGIHVFEDLLSIDFSTGLTCVDFTRRKAFFGKNQRRKGKEKTFCDFVKDAISDKILIILLIMGGISLGLGLGLEPEHRSTAWIEGFAIIFAVFLVVSVMSLNDYQKAKKFKELQESYKTRQNVTVFRCGAYTSMHPSKILVGDIIEISDGNIIPVDGILIDASNVEVDEAAMTGENDKVIKVSYKEAISLRNEYIEKGRVTDDGLLHHAVPSCIYISGTTLAEGRGKMLVLGIGENSCEGRLVDLAEQDQPETPLQLKLDRVADFVTKLGLICSGIAVFVLFIRFFIELGTGTEEWNDGQYKHMLEFLITGITVLVVAIPEGLPLAVTISLAYSVKKMQLENNLVKRFHACETMGGANMICSDKTGTLTTNQMTVEHFWMSLGKIVPDYNKHFSARPEYFAKLKENLCVNTNARMQEGKEIGSKTEIALIKMLIKFGHDDYQQIRDNYRKRPTKIFPFSSSRKRSSIVISLDEDGVKSRAHVMGASEVVFSKCKYILNLDGSTSLLTNETRKLGEDVILEMAEGGLRTICLAYREISPGEDFHKTINNIPVIEESDLVCLAIVGIKDPVRPEVPQAVNKCKIAGIKVRMVTGDNKITARAIAKECGILSDENSIVMEGKEFRELCGGTVCSNCLTDLSLCKRLFKSSKR